MRGKRGWQDEICRPFKPPTPCRRKSFFLLFAVPRLVTRRSCRVVTVAHGSEVAPNQPQIRSIPNALDVVNNRRRLGASINAAPRKICQEFRAQLSPCSVITALGGCSASRIVVFQLLLARAPTVRPVHRRFTWHDPPHAPASWPHSTTPTASPALPACGLG